jgi:hypothetical protein
MIVTLFSVSLLLLSGYHVLEQRCPEYGFIPLPLTFDPRSVRSFTFVKPRDPTYSEIVSGWVSVPRAWFYPIAAQIDDVVDRWDHLNIAGLFALSDRNNLAPGSRPVDMVRTIGVGEWLNYVLVDRPADSFYRMFESDVETWTRGQLRCSAELAEHRGWKYSHTVSSPLTAMCILRERSGVNRPPVLSILGLLSKILVPTVVFIALVVGRITLPICYYQLYMWAWDNGRHKKVEFVRNEGEGRMPITLPTCPGKVENDVFKPSKNPEEYFVAFGAHFDQVLSPRVVCYDCTTGSCLQHTGSVVVMPGMMLGKDALCAIARRPNVFIDFADSIQHADCVQKDNTFSVSKRTFVHKGSTVMFDSVNYPGRIFSMHQAYTTSMKIVKPRDPITKTVNGCHFVIDHGLITMIHPVRETVPLHVFTGISSRLATDAGDSTTLYDHVRNFLASKVIANSITLTHTQEWIFLLVDLTNRNSINASNSVRMNLPMGSSLVTRGLYNLTYYMGRFNPWNSVPTNTEYLFPDTPIPSYEVHSTKKHTLEGGTFKPEPTDPFQDVCPSVDAPVVEQPECSASPDRHECTDLDGNESLGTATDPEPSHYRAPCGLTYDFCPCAPLSECVYAPPDNVSPSSRVECEPEPGCTDDGKRGCVGVIADESRDCDAATFGEASVYLMPIIATRDDGSTVQGWWLTLEGGIYTEPLPLRGCFTCATRIGQQAIERRLDPVAYLADALSKPNFRSNCSANAEGARPSRTCKLASSGLSESDVLHVRRQRVAARLLPKMGEEVSGEPEENVNSRARTSRKSRRSNKKGRNRQMLFKNGDLHKDDRSQEY